jgi:hypothetical protein
MWVVLLNGGDAPVDVSFPNAWMTSEPMYSRGPAVADAASTITSNEAGVTSAARAKDTRIRIPTVYYRAGVHA